jgi:uncharacterized Zn finger protein (UPF0148 family)
VHYNSFDKTTKKSVDISSLLQKDGFTFCQYCEQNETCDKKDKPKILAVSRKIMRYLNEEKRGRLEYPFAGSWEHQPEWFIEMLEAGRRQEQDLNENKDSANGR